MDKDRIAYLCKQYLDGIASREELLELEGNFRNPVMEDLVKAVLFEVYAEFSENNYPDLDARISEDIFSRISSQVSSKPTIRLWLRIAVAVAAVTVIVFSIWIFNNQDGNRVKSERIAANNDVAPGKQGATLTLGNGKKILIKDISSGNIASQSGVKIIKSKNGQVIYQVTDKTPVVLEYNTLSTTKGEQTQVRLPDGSLVYLNAASSLKYPTSFSSLKERRVTLKGEGYFEIAKDKAHPFIVTTNKQETEVLGTHFNVNAYDDESSITTILIEGMVKVSSKKGVRILEPGQQSSVTDNTIQVAQGNIDEAVAWRKGYFRYTDEQLSVVMRQIARWYNVEIIYPQGIVPQVALNGKINMNRNISQVLRMLAKTKEVNFKVEGRKVYVLK
ncbi:FecR family protein [Pedobacter miscanthi]|uniref:Anti-sigma factor n=1 Tax=Pedobacter miscanthi TaxID=2259170 RepID=A0A366L434_9SPHI|nr:FecR family protein [Pedobacter miscanthi]RBQ07902.1 anti-sigma factor [Pedobacter miscanthi]